MLRQRQSLVLTLSWLVYAVGVCILIVTMQKNAPAQTIPLFASGRVLAVYSFTALPIGYLGGRMLVGRPFKYILWIMALICFLSVALWPVFSIALAQNQATGLGRGIVRCICAALLVCPLSFALAIKSPVSSNGSSNVLSMQTLFVVSVCAILLPTVYVQNQLRMLGEAIIQQSSSGRVARAFSSATQYWELVGDQVIGQERLAERIKVLRHEYRELVKRTLAPSGLNRDELQQCAMLLLSLDRAQEAHNLLAQVSPTPDTLLIQALAARELKHWSKVEQYCYELNRLGRKESVVYDLLGEACHRQRKLADAIRVYQSLLDLSHHDPLAAAGVHVRLGKVCMDQGDRGQAMYHFAQAKRLDPQQSLQLARLQRTAIQSGCQLHPAR